MFMEDVEQCSGQKCQSYAGEAASNVTADTVYQALLNRYYSHTSLLDM